MIKSKIKNLDLSATLKINEISKSLEKQGKKIIKFGFGQSPFPVPDSIVEELKKNAHQKSYLPIQGLDNLRDAISKYESKKKNKNFSSEQIIIGPGSKELMFSLQLALKGITILPAPCWVSYSPQAKILNREIIFTQTRYEDNWQLLPYQLTKVINNSRSQPKLLILNYPGNPHGCTFETELLKELANVCRKNKIIVLSDEIYSRIHYQGEHVSIARYYPEGTIISSGLSKWCAAGGWRLGHFSFPKELQHLQTVMASVASETYSCVSTPIQYAGITAYEDESIDNYLFHCRRVLETVGQYCASKLIDAGIKVRMPVGAFYIFPNFQPFEEILNERNIYDSKTLCKQLLDDTGVALLPGSDFGRKPKELSARLAYVNFNGNETLRKSMELSKESVLTMEHLSESVLDIVNGINEIINWIKS